MLERWYDLVSNIGLYQMQVIVEPSFSIKFSGSAETSFAQRNVSELLLMFSLVSKGCKRAFQQVPYRKLIWKNENVFSQNVSLRNDLTPRRNYGYHCLEELEKIDPKKP